MRNFPLAGALALLLSACAGENEFQGECKRDSDCRSYQRCDTLNFRCVCASDEACASGEFCNSSGSCQKITTCFSNADCQQDTICDVQSGNCIPATSCTTDFHCDLGQICVEGTCRTGCRETSDCDLQKREVCIDGACWANRCENNRYCDFGKVCQHETHVCQLPTEPHCTPGCSPTCEPCGNDITIGPCGDPRNVCVGTSETHCWVYCEKDDDCPSGYLCAPTTVEWSPVCQTDLDCTENPNPNDRVINLCDGTAGGQNVGRCRLNKQPCRKNEDCYPFVTRCVANQCIFASHCRPPGGCP